MKKTYIITAINPDDNHIVSVWTKSETIQEAAEKSYKLLRDEYNIKGYLEKILSISLMSSNPKHYCWFL